MNTIDILSEMIGLFIKLLVKSLSVGELKVALNKIGQVQIQ